MAAMAAVDLGAQSGRVAVGRFDGERLDRRRGAPVRERSRPARRDAPLGRPAALRGDARRPPAAARDGSVALGRGRLVGRRLRPPRPVGRARRATRSTTATRAVPQRDRRRATRGSRRASSTSEPGIQLIPINTIFELAAMARRERPVTRSRGDAPADPRPLPLLAVRERTTRVHERDHDAVLRPADAATGRPTCSSGSSPRAAPARGRPARHTARPARRRRGRATGLDGATRDRGRHARHRFGCCRCALSVGPTRSTSAPERGRSSAWRCDEPLINGRELRRQPDERGRRRRHVPPAQERHRALASPRVPARRGPLDGHEHLLRRTRRRWPRRRRRFARSIDPDDPAFAAPGDMPARIADVLHAHAASRSRRCPARRPLHPREPRAQARADGRRCSPRRHRHRARASCTSSAAAPETSCSASGPRTRRAACARRAGGGDVIGNLLVQAMALGELGSLEEARDVVARLLRPDRLRAAPARRSGPRRASGSPRSSPQALAVSS